MTRGELRLVETSLSSWTSIALNVFDRLIELDADGNLVPGLATEWRWLDDRTLAVTLRQGVKFHNGEDFDAAIVKLNWEVKLSALHMERHARDQAYFLFLYNPIQLYAVNKVVTFVPYATTRLILTETSVTEQHWSVRQDGIKP
jgi:ABC-type oligopeptide transport system substrate-binding subunit